MSVIWWTDEQKELLKNLYPSTDKKKNYKSIKTKNMVCYPERSKKLKS